MLVLEAHSASDSDLHSATDTSCDGAISDEVSESGPISCQVHLPFFGIAVVRPDALEDGYCPDLNDALLCCHCSCLHGARKQHPWQISAKDSACPVQTSLWPLMLFRDRTNPDSGYWQSSAVSDEAVEVYVYEADQGRCGRARYQQAKGGSCSDTLAHRSAVCEQQTGVQNVRGSPKEACSATICRSMPHHAAVCRNTWLLELYMSVFKHAAALRSMPQFRAACPSTNNSALFIVIKIGLSRK